MGGRLDARAELLARLAPAPAQRAAGEKLVSGLNDAEAAALLTSLKRAGRPVSCKIAFLVEEGISRFVAGATAADLEVLGWHRIRPGSLDVEGDPIRDLVLGRTPPRSFVERVTRFLATWFTARQVRWIVRVLVRVSDAWQL